MSGAPATAELPSHEGVADTLRQMIAVLETERQALAALDADGLVDAARVKEGLCHALAPLGPGGLDAETRGLAETAQRLNDVNRRVRNLLAANVAARIAALGEDRCAPLPTYGTARMPLAGTPVGAAAPETPGNA